MSNLTDCVRTAATRVKESIFTRTFGVVTSIATALAAPFVIAVHNAKSDRQTKATAELMALIRDAKEVTENDTLRLELALGYFEENESLFNLSTAKFQELVSSRKKQIIAEKSSGEDTKMLKEKYAETTRKLEAAKSELLAAKKADARTQEDLARKKQDIERLNEALKSAPAAEQAKLKTQMDDLQGQVKKSEDERDQGQQTISQQNDRIAELQKTLDAPRPEVLVDAEDSGKAGGNGNSPNISDEQIAVAQAGAELERLQGENERLYRLLNNALGGTWIYLGWHDSGRRLNNSSVELQDKPAADTRTTYNLITGVNVRKLPTKDSEKLFVIDRGFRVKLAEIKETNPVSENGGQGKAVWARLKDINAPRRPAWYRRIFGGG